MRARLCLLALLPLLSYACDDGDADEVDPCARVVCRQGQDCVQGACVDRDGEGGSGGGGAGGGGGVQGCGSNLDCAFDPAGRFCEVTVGRCVECLTDDGCAAGETCVASVCEGGACEADADCAPEAPFCRLATGACVACLGAEHCGAGERCADGACTSEPLACLSDVACEAGDPARPLCEVEAGEGRCVACRRAQDCASPGALCLGGACVDRSCASDGACAQLPEHPFCNGARGLCVGCRSGDDCGPLERCGLDGCEPQPLCGSDADCSGDPRGPLCDAADGACVVCRDERDCAPGARCEARSSCAATPCVTLQDCAPGLACVDAACAAGPACASDQDCGLDPRAPRCGSAGACVACRSSEDCGPGARCDAERCVRPQNCATDADCAGGFACDDALCVPCREDSACPRGRCEAGFCADRPACEADADCATGRCGAGTCVACVRDVDCRAGLWCEEGACVPAPGCATDRDCGAGQLCSEGACASAGCVDDSVEPDDDERLAQPLRGDGAPLFATLCPNDPDLYAFTAPPGAGLSASLGGAPEGATLTLVWYAPGARERRTLRAPEGRLALEALPEAAANRWYLAVEGAAGVAGSYALSALIERAGGSCDDALEPNDTRNAPWALALPARLEGLALCGDDDFFTVTVPEGRSLVAHLFATEGSPQLELFTLPGARLATGAPTTEGPGGVRASAGPAGVGGEPWLVKISRGPARYSLALTTSEDPTCADAPLLFEGPAGDRGRAHGSTLGAPASLDAGSCAAGGPDVAYAFELAASSSLRAELRADAPLSLSLQDAACGVERSCAPPLAAGATLELPSVEPGLYRLVVSGAPGAAGDFELAVRAGEAIAAPVNDLCAGATPLELASGRATVAGSTRGAHPDEQLCGFGGDVFYAFTLAAPARVVADVQADAPVTVGLADAACTAASCGAAGRAGRLDVTLEAGEHRLVVAPEGSGAASYALTVTLPPTLPNEACVDAIPLPFDVTSGDTTWASGELSLPLATSCTGYLTDGPDAFFSLPMVAGERLQLELRPDGWDGALYVLQDCASQQCVAGVDAAFAGGFELLDFTAPLDGTYVIVVDGAGEGGPYTLTRQ